MCARSWGDEQCVCKNQKEPKIRVILSSESYLWGLQVQFCVCQRDCADPWTGRALPAAAPKLRDLSGSFCGDGGSVMSCDQCDVRAWAGILWPWWLGWVALFQTLAFVWQPKSLHPGFPVSRTSWSCSSITWPRLDSSHSRTWITWCGLELWCCASMTLQISSWRWISFQIFASLMLVWSQGSKLTLLFLINCFKCAMKFVLLILPCQLFLQTAWVLRVTEPWNGWDWKES